MRILSVVLAIALLAGTLPFAALADGDDDTRIRLEARYEDDNGTEIRIREETRIRDGEIREEVRERREDAREQRTEIRERVQERREDAREQRSEIRERVRERHEDVRERVREAREDMREHRDAFAQARVRVQTCDDANDSCAEARAQLIVHTDIFLESTAQRLLAHLDQLEDFVLLNVPEDDRQGYLDAINESRGDIEIILADLPDEPAPSDLRAAAAAFKDEWREIQGLTKDARRDAVKEKVNNSTRRLANLQEKLLEMRESLLDAGADVTELDLLLAEFEAELEASVQASTAEEARESFSNAVHLLREIMHEIRDARAEVRGEIVGDDDANEQEDEHGEVEVEITGNVNLTSDVEAKLDELAAAVENSTVELKLNVTRTANETVVTAEVEGDALSDDEQTLFEELQDLLRALVDTLSEGASIEIEVEHDAA